MFSNRGIMVAGLGLLLTVSAQAATIDGTNVIPDCSSGGCGWSVRVDGAWVGGGSYNIDPETGDISLDQPWTSGDLGDGVFVSVNSMSGNADPILGFNASAGTGAAGNTFAFNFSMPIALSGLIDANSSISYSLTALSAAGAQIMPLFGKVAIAQEVDTTPGGLTPLNKGVDVGDTFFFLAGPLTMNSPVYTASNSFVGNLAYDRMSVTLAFSLSPSSQVGMSGFVQQNLAPVPVPAAVWLLASAIGVLGVIRRRLLRA